MKKISSAPKYTKSLVFQLPVQTRFQYELGSKSDVRSKGCRCRGKLVSEIVQNRESRIARQVTVKMTNHLAGGGYIAS